MFGRTNPGIEMVSSKKIGNVAVPTTLNEGFPNISMSTRFSSLLNFLNNFPLLNNYYCYYHDQYLMLLLFFIVHTWFVSIVSHLQANG